MNLDVVQSIWNIIQGTVSSILDAGRIFYIGLGFSVLMVIFFFIKSHFSYEVRLEKTVNRLNEWLFKNQTINESNLIEFNNLIKEKRSPKILRKHWQQYMLYRDKLPSEYISAYNCIDKPLKTSSYKANIKNFNAILRFAAIFTLFLTLVTYAGRSELLLTYLSLSMVTSVVILLISLIATLVMRTMQNYNMAGLYQAFHIFNRYLDKASVDIPKYVDFEILFTKKEIKEGIPILGEYLEKRARQEQEELEEAKRNAVSHEEYDFTKSGVDGSLVLERAMKESETYLNAKQRLLAEIQQFESEISTLKKNYENTSKDFQRKLQASKENMERLRQQQEESTNRIEVNYIRKQQQDEVRKQEQFEKDLDDATNKFNAEVNSLNEEIEKRKAAIEQKRVKVQEAMLSEYQTFSVKLHGAVSRDVEKEKDDDIQKLTNEKEQYAQAINFLKNEVDGKDALIKSKDQTIYELQKRVLVLEGEGKAAENIEANQMEPKQEEPKSQEEIKIEENKADEVKAEEIKAEEKKDEAVEVTPQEEAPVEAIQEEEDGHYDEKGYYWFLDKTYYDAEGLYHDLEGNVYDSDGNLLKTNQVVESEGAQPSVEEILKEVPVMPSNEEALEPKAEGALAVENEAQGDAIEHTEENKTEDVVGVEENKQAEPVPEKETATETVEEVSKEKQKSASTKKSTKSTAPKAGTKKSTTKATTAKKVAPSAKKKNTSQARGRTPNRRSLVRDKKGEE